MNPLFRLVGWTLFASTFSGNAIACWVEKIHAVDGVVRVFLIARYKDRDVHISRGNQPLKSLTQEEGRPAYFELSVGDRAIVHGGSHHDVCTYTAEIREGKLGVLLNAHSRPNGFPASEGINFVPAEKVPAAGVPGGGS